jgi:hypothetical protein
MKWVTPKDDMVKQLLASTVRVMKNIQYQCDNNE